MSSLAHAIELLGVLVQPQAMLQPRRKPGLCGRSIMV